MWNIEEAMSRLTISEKAPNLAWSYQRRSNKRKWEAVHPAGIKRRPVSLSPDRKRRRLDQNEEQTNRIESEAQEEMDTSVTSPSSAKWYVGTQSTRVKQTLIKGSGVQQTPSCKRKWEAVNPAGIRRKPVSLSPDRKRRRLDLHGEQATRQHTKKHSHTEFPVHNEGEWRQSLDEALRHRPSLNKNWTRNEQHPSSLSLQTFLPKRPKWTTVQEIKNPQHMCHCQ